MRSRLTDELEERRAGGLVECRTTHLEQYRQHHRRGGDEQQAEERDDSVAGLVLSHRAPCADRDTTGHADDGTDGHQADGHTDPGAEQGIDRLPVRRPAPVPVAEDHLEPANVSCPDTGVGIDVVIGQRRIDRIPVEFRIGAIKGISRIQRRRGHQIGQRHGDEQQHHVVDKTS